MRARNARINISLILLFIFGVQTNKSFESEKRELLANEIKESVTIDKSAKESITNLTNSQRNLAQKNNELFGGDIGFPITEENLDDISEISLIENSSYFVLNPLHGENDGSDNPLGTCTTVAFQMLIGYHNYNSDRRIIPGIDNGHLFLDPDYGNLEYHPTIKRNIASNLGCEKIGTTQNFYQALMDLNPIGTFPGLGQTFERVFQASRRFFNQHSDELIRDRININHGLYNRNQTLQELNENRPVVLGFDSLIFPTSFHVVVAYGTAKHNDEEGYIVHYGHFHDKTFYWVPESEIGFQARMSVNDIVYDYEETGVVVGERYREQKCNTTGVSRLLPLFKTTPVNGGLSVSLASNVNLAGGSNIHIPQKGEDGTEVIEIANYAFENQTGISRINIPPTVTKIGKNAFLNTGGATINLMGLSSAPESYSYNWNPSNNRVTLDEEECLHINKPLVFLTSSKHGEMCTVCRTSFNIEGHNYTYQALLGNLNEHHAHCDDCGYFTLKPHAIPSHWPFPGNPRCLLCGGEAQKGFLPLFGKGFTNLQTSDVVNVGEDSYVLPNGVIVLGEMDLISFYNGTLDIDNLCQECY